MKNLVIFILLPIIAIAQESQKRDWNELFRSSPKVTLGALVQDRNQDQSDTVSMKIQPKGAKSMKKAFFFSALIPGTGEMYAGSFLKGFAFLAVEVGAWTMYAVYNKEGKNIEKEFHAFADAHWIEDDYWDYIARISGRNRNDLESLREWEHANFSHGLHREKDQQYYEMIGKYDQFNYGWDDTDKGLKDPDWDLSMRSKKRLYYEDRRDDSNKAFKTATWGTMIALFNHAFSAVDAAWTANRHNKKLATATIRMQPIQYGYESVPAFSLILNW